VGANWCRLTSNAVWPPGRFELSGSSHASCSLSKGIIRVVDLFEMILPVGDPAEEPEPTPRRALADLLRDVVLPAPCAGV
jgi:hypothetical protein